MSHSKMKTNHRLGVIFFASLCAWMGSLQSPVLAQTPPTPTYSIAHFYSTGQSPQGALVQDPSGYFYGTCEYGGATGSYDGQIDQLVPQSNAAQPLHSNILYSFAGAPADGEYPTSGLVEYSAGVFYGTTSYGGSSNDGVIFELADTGNRWVESIVHNFGVTAGDGIQPSGALILATDGNLYGVASGGGSNSTGVVYQFIPSTNAVIILHNFGDGSVANDGEVPNYALLEGADGKLYGTTSTGGVYGQGTLFNLTIPSTLGGASTEKILYSFGNPAVTNDGNDPIGVTQGTDGNFYGATYEGGYDNYGTLFQYVPPTGTQTIGTVNYLHIFGAGVLTSDGQNPVAPPTEGIDGNFYGATAQGGTAELGTLYRYTTTGAFAILHNFGDSTVTNDGELPSTNGAILSAANGELYGQTSSGGQNGDGAVYSLSLNLPTAASPLISPFSGSFQAGQQVTMTDGTTGAAIWYTTDGTTPVPGSGTAVLYTGPITVNVSETINAIATLSGYMNSPVSSASIGIQAATPVITPNSGTYGSPQTVTITDSTPNATIWYTTDGSIPEPGSGTAVAYTGQFVVSDTTYINAIAIAPMYASSALASQELEIPQVLPTPTITPDGGSTSLGETATITDSNSTAAIYYSTNASSTNPTWTQYTGPVTITGSETLTAMAVKNGEYDSLTATAVFGVAQTFSTGIQLISLPYSYAETPINTLFGVAPLTLAVWSPSTGMYNLTPSGPTNTIVLGQGYWVRFPASSTPQVTTIGTAAPTSSPFTISLQQGWNMIGDPFPTSIPLADLTFNGGTETYNAATGGIDPLIDPSFYSFNGSAYVTATSLMPDVGYWVYANFATDIEVPGPNEPTGQN